MPLKRYFIVSTGIASTALGLAIIVSVLALLYATSAVARLQELSAVSYESDTSSSYLEIVSFQIDQLPASSTRPPAAQIALMPLVPAQATPKPGSGPTRVTTRGRIKDVNITFYDCKDQGFCGAMYNGRKVREGAAACSWNLPIGTKFKITGDPTKRTYVCEDRGELDNTWVDVFWNDPKDGWKWQASVGRFGTIEVVEVPR